MGSLRQGESYVDQIMRRLQGTSDKAQVMRFRPLWVRLEMVARYLLIHREIT